MARQTQQSPSRRGPLDKPAYGTDNWQSSSSQNAREACWIVSLAVQSFAAKRAFKAQPGVEGSRGILVSHLPTAVYRAKSLWQIFAAHYLL